MFGEVWIFGVVVLASVEGYLGRWCKPEAGVIWGGGFSQGWRIFGVVEDIWGGGFSQCRGIFGVVVLARGG